MFTPDASTVGPSPASTPSPFRPPTLMPTLAPTPGANFNGPYAPRTHSHTSASITFGNPHTILDGRINTRAFFIDGISD